MLLVTIIKMVGNRHGVFFVYKYGCLDFWNGINPYSQWEHDYDRFVYGPIFSIFFSVYAFINSYIGAFLWNLTNYLIWFYAIFSLPENRYTFENKRFLFLMLLPISTTDLFFFQYNITVAYLFLLAYSFFEKGKYWQALSVILFSGFTKIYGFVQLGFLIVYKKFWRNVLFVAILSVILFFLPVIKIPLLGLVDYYQSWFGAMSERHNPVFFENIYNLLNFIGFNNVSDYVLHITLAGILFICLFTIINRKYFTNFAFRTMLLGVIMSWVVIFSKAAEAHTYVVAMLGYLLWYIQYAKSKFDKILLWTNFFLITLVPIDIIVPVPIMEFLYYKIHLNLIVFVFTWFRMFYTTFSFKYSQN